jgi:hypothetical protein
LALRDVGKEAFQSQMRNLFGNVIFGDRKNEDKLKFGYSKWMEDKLINTQYNTMPVLEKYRKFLDALMNQEELAAFRTKVNSFSNIMKN